MPIEWSEGIVLAELAEEPELSEELSALVERVKTPPPGKSVPHVVLSFGGVDYLNSSHIASMLRLRKLLIERGRQLVLSSVSDELWSIILLTGLDKVFIVAPDTMTALARIQLESGEAESPEA
jgi:anti-anti-sigma factor